MGRFRLQIAITLLTAVILVAVVGYLALDVGTELIADYGGTYVEGVAGNPRYINPLLCYTNAVDQDLCALIFNGLTRATDRGEIVPDLAESWEVSPDGIVYTFRLRQDVTWHDGAPFTADDVIYTFTTIQSPDFPGDSTLTGLWSTVVLEKVDAYTVRFILREPYAPFLDHTTMGILPVHILGGVPPAQLTESLFNVEAIGTGPFMLDEISARRVVLVSNPDYHGSRPYLDRIEFLLYQDESAVFEARRSGEVAGIARIDSNYLTAVRKDDGLTLYAAPLSGYTMVYLNLDRGVFQDPAVRQAMMLALDRQMLVDEVLSGQGIVIDSPILPNSWAHDPNITHYGYDPRKAIATLEENGWFDDDGDGVRERGTVRLEFTLVTSDDPVRVRLTRKICDQLTEVGIHATPETVPWDTLRNDVLRLRRYDAILLAFQNLPPDPDPYPYWHSSQANEYGFNFANFNNAQADTLLQEARLTTDTETRYELYREFQDLFARLVPSLPLYQPVYSYAVSSSVRDVQIGPMLTSGDRFRSVTSWYINTQRLTDDGE